MIGKYSTIDCVSRFKYCPDDPRAVKKHIKACSFDHLTRIIVSKEARVVGIIVVEGDEVVTYSEDEDILVNDVEEE